MPEAHREGVVSGEAKLQQDLLASTLCYQWALGLTCPPAHYGLLWAQALRQQHGDSHHHIVYAMRLGPDRRAGNMA